MTLQPSPRSTLRFWVFDRGWIKLSLKPGRTLSNRRATYTDDGWIRTAFLYKHAGDRVLSAVYTDGIDCDGRYQHDAEFEALATELKHHKPSWDDDPPLDDQVPLWRLTTEESRDF